MALPHPGNGGSIERRLRRRCRQFVRLHMRGISALVCCAVLTRLSWPTGVARMGSAYSQAPDASNFGPAFTIAAAAASHRKADNRRTTALAAAAATVDGPLRIPKSERRLVSSLEVGETMDTAVVDKFWKNFAVLLDIGAHKRGMLTMEEFTDGFPLDGWPPELGSTLTGLRVLDISPEGTFTLTRRTGDLSRPPPPSKVMKREEDLQALGDAWHEGEVNGFANYGVFVTVVPSGGQAVSGLLPISDFPEGFASQAMRGLKVKVRVLDLDLVKKRVTFTGKDP